MTITYNYNPEKGALYATIEGLITFEDFQLTLASITEVEDIPPNTRILWDLRKMDFSNIDWDFSKELVKIRALNPKRANSKVALIADKDVEYGITEMHVLQSNKQPDLMRAFKSYEEGERWLLGLDEY